MTPTLAGQHALVTGGGTGIGAAVARRLAQAGAKVTLLGRRRAQLEDARRELVAGTGAEVGCVVGDVTDEAAVRAAFDEAQAARGVPTILVNNAGAAPTAPAAKTSLELWSSTLAVNLTGTFLCSREFLLRLPRESSGRIVNVASTAGLKGYAYVSAYCAAKHGVVGYTRALAAELARRPVTVNAVCPGYTETPLLEGAVAAIVSATGRAEDGARAELARSNPQGRFVQPAEVAEAVHWLCLPESASVTGTAVAIAGGEI
ncbi:MAG: SDR family NAD(P)-dependent oxidoreductase [Steroidobacteraceae bacterium]|jgi:NAD(P)-dependent dehydrogenase (short-subunit alcohol dehydrogenase family)|nr:SDR family NAD(P)-dependent oxidoreductase [Steroidobacteraceae bacterium]